jgi:hypothetical protein
MSTLTHRLADRTDPVRGLPVRALRALTTWHLTSVQGARRNALVASTALAARRAELVEVEEFLVAHRTRWESRRAAVG